MLRNNVERGKERVALLAALALQEVFPGTRLRGQNPWNPVGVDFEWNSGVFTVCSRCFCLSSTAFSWSSCKCGGSMSIALILHAASHRCSATASSVFLVVVGDTVQPNSPEEAGMRPVQPATSHVNGLLLRPHGGEGL